MSNEIRDSKETGINLEINGRLFPSWLLLNFKSYEIPEILRKEGDDPCNETIVKELTVYQKFLGQFLNYRSPFKDMLIYHGLGSGKTVSAINIYNVLYNYTPKWNVFLLIKASLKNDPWLKDLNDWIGTQDRDAKMANIKFIHYDSPYADRDFLETVKKSDSSRESLFIIDEAHNFIRNVYNNISSKKGKRAQVIYDYIQQEKKDSNKTRVILLSGTPAVNNPFEFALIFNLLRPETFPTSEAIFNQLYISSTNFESLNENKKNLFQRRIMGLASYYIGSTPDKFARKTTHYKELTMGAYQLEVYNYLEEIEQQKEKMRKKFSRGKLGGDDMSTYASYTRQACNFVFPNISSTINGEKRPRPGMFRIEDKDAILVDEGKKVDKIQSMKKSSEAMALYIKKCQEFINATINYFKELHREDKENNHTLQTDIKNFFDKYEGSFTIMVEKTIGSKSEKADKVSKLFESLYNHGPKMLNIIFNIIKSPGSALVYSNYVEMEGLQVFKIYLAFFGFISIDDDKEFDIANISNNKKTESKNGLRFMEFHGAINKELREQNKKIFNMKENKIGDVIKIIMISPAGAEGINLNNCRQVHILEPYWNEVRIEQVIGRAVRQCHHKELPLNERTVDVFRYKMVRDIDDMKKLIPKEDKEKKYKSLVAIKTETSDEMMENISRRKNNLLLSFIEAIKEASVDCELFKAHNMMGSKYSCFKFNEESQFDRNVGPAYNKDIEIDGMMDNGSNAIDSIKKRIKVRKIKVVKKIDETSYSEEINAWFYEQSGTVYDNDLDYPIGKVGKDSSGNYMKLDKDIYIMENVINIPIFKLYE
uniref:Helicase ATP-binding domain-containing protein n=1 Tax=viral metagenome TaxID=1070528 RepID=A0A6C0HVB3_9ZZZZ